MRLTHLQTSLVYIARMVSVTGDRMAFVTVTGEMAHIQPSNNSSTEIAEGVFGKSFKFYFDGGADIQPGDRLRNDETDEYFTVIADGVSRRSYGSLDYLIVVTQKTTY